MTTNQQLAQQAAVKVFHSDYRTADDIATIVADTYEPVLKERDELRNALAFMMQVNHYGNRECDYVKQALTHAEAILNQKKGE